MLPRLKIDYKLPRPWYVLSYSNKALEKVMWTEYKYDFHNYRQTFMTGATGEIKLLRHNRGALDKLPVGTLFVHLDPAQPTILPYNVRVILHKADMRGFKIVELLG